MPSLDGVSKMQQTRVMIHSTNSSTEHVSGLHHV